MSSSAGSRTTRSVCRRMPVKPHSICAATHAARSSGDLPMAIPMVRKRAGYWTAARDNSRRSGQVAAVPTIAASAPFASMSARYSSALRKRGRETCPHASIILGRPSLAEAWADATPADAAREAAASEVFTNARRVVFSKSLTEINLSLAKRRPALHRLDKVFERPPGGFFEALRQHFDGAHAVQPEVAKVFARLARGGQGPGGAPKVDGQGADGAQRRAPRGIDILEAQFSPLQHGLARGFQAGGRLRLDM